MFYHASLSQSREGTRLLIKVPSQHPCLTDTSADWKELFPFIQDASSDGRENITFTFKFREDTDERVERIVASIMEYRDDTAKAHIQQLFQHMCMSTSHTTFDVRTFYLAREYVAFIKGVPCDGEIDTSERALMSARAHMTTIGVGAEIDLAKFQLCKL